MFAVAAFSNVNIGGHSNTERGYLAQLQPRLLRELASEDGEMLEVAISQADKDPLKIS